MIPRSALTLAALQELLSDHLGSTSITTDASGNKIAELRYKAWGEVRYTDGDTPTDYQYTGQRSDSYINLLDYGSRRYDPVLGRFISPDPIVPTQTQGTQAYDRYAYVNNNPVKYTDPSGHCIFCIAVPVLTALGYIPDIEGIANVVMFAGAPNAVVASGLAVQSEYPLAMFVGNSYGMAQVSNEQMKSYGLEGKNQLWPSVAEDAMAARIGIAVDKCKQCQNGTDRLIVAALAQNGSEFEGKHAFQNLPKNADGTINWSNYLKDNGGNPSEMAAQMRQGVTRMNYGTTFMLKLFIQDLRVLMSLGYELPEQYKDANLDEIEKLLKPKPST